MTKTTAVVALSHSLLVAAFLLGCSAHHEPPHFQSTSAALEARDRTATADDLETLDRASEILASPAVWDRDDNRVCEPNAESWSLFCALHKASIEVLGEYQHRSVALQEVRFAIEDVSVGREFEHRLMDFNNLPSTTFEEIHQVLNLARERTSRRLAEPPPGAAA
jgi:hypothetical protein